MHRVIVVGSPRVDGRSAHLADELFNACIEECPEDGVSIVSVASIEVGPCRGCDACRAATQAPDALPEDDDNLAIVSQVAHSDALAHRCVIHDDMTEVRKHLDAADELIVVAPVYFSGPPAQFKCLLDRLQPYYWSDMRAQSKRPCVLHVVGEGGDPHGFEPLIGCVRSAFACAGFRLELVLDWVGKITADGEITDDAEEYVVELDDAADAELALDANGAAAGFAGQESASAADALGVGERELNLAAFASEELVVGTSGEGEARKGKAAGKPSGERARLSLAEGEPSKGGAGRQGQRGAQQGGAWREHGQRGSQRGGSQGKGAHAGAAARGGGHAGGKGPSGSKRGSGAGQKGRASYGKNAQGKGKRRG